MSEHPSPQPALAELEQAADALVAAWSSGADRLPGPVSSPQLRALLALEKQDSMSLGGLGEALGSLPSSVSRLCDRLEAGGLVTRRANDVNRRAITIRLTADGRQLLTQLHATRTDLLSDVLSRMSPASRQALLAGLREFTRALRFRPLSAAERTDAARRLEAAQRTDIAEGGDEQPAD
jgi:DNA-binding MarR family transcriptional regulator